MVPEKSISFTTGEPAAAPGGRRGLKPVRRPACADVRFAAARGLLFLTAFLTAFLAGIGSSIVLFIRHIMGQMA
jgi:hypothetical protein